MSPYLTDAEIEALIRGLAKHSEEAKRVESKAEGLQVIPESEVPTKRLTIAKELCSKIETQAKAEGLTIAEFIKKVINQ